MARPNLRSAARQSTAQDAYDLPRSSSNEREEGTTKRTTRRAQASHPPEQPTRRSRRVNETGGEDPVSEQRPRKRRRTQRQEAEVNAETAETPRDQDQNEEDEEEDSRPSDAFLASINEGIRGDVLPTNRRNHSLAQEQQPREEPEPEAEPEQEQEAEAPIQTPQEATSEQRRTSYNTRVRTRKSRDQRTLVAEPSTGQVSLAPETGNITLPTPQNRAEPEADARSDPSPFVGSEQGEEDESLQEAGDDAENISVQEAEHEADDHGVQEKRDGGANQAPEDDIVGYLELHGRSGPEHKRPVVKVRAGKLAYLEKTVSSKNWTGLNAELRQTLLRRANESEKRWHKRLRKYGLSTWSGAKDMLGAIDSLQEIIQDSPKMPRADEQNAHFSANLDDLKEVVTWTQDLANNLGDELISGVRRDEQNRPAAAAAEATTRVYIPLLVLTLCESFRLGGAFDGEDGSFEAVSAGTFTNVSLGITRYLADVIMKLWEDLMEYRIQAREDHKPLQRLHDQLASFERSLDEGLRIIKDRDPERLRRAKARDGKIEEARQMEEQERIEERETRMSAFIASTQKIRQSLSSPVQATQPPRSTPQHPRSTPQQPFRSTVIDLGDDEDEEHPFNDSRDEDQAIAEQLEQERQEREQVEARKRRIAMLKEQDRRAQERRDAEARARKEAMERRFQAFIASSQQMRV